MTSNLKKTPLMGWDLCAIAVLLLPACFLYLWRTLRTHLIYAAFGDFVDFPVFIPGRVFFLERLASAGGLVGYVADFLSQGFYYDAVGALVITAVAVAFYLVTFILLQVVTGIRSHVLAAVPAIAAVALYGDYNHQLLGLLAVLLSVVFTAAFAMCRPRNHTAAVALFAAMFVLLYWAAAAASLVFAVLVALAELLRGKWLNALADIAFAAASAYFMGAFLFLLEMPRPFTAGLPIFPLTMTLHELSLTYLCLFFPLALLAAAAGRKVFHAARTAEIPVPARRGRKSRHHHKNPRGPLIPAPLAPWLKTAAALLVIAAGAVFAVRWTHDPDRKHILRMNDLLRNRQWQACIDAAKTFQQRGFYNVQVNHDVNRALYHAGRLPDEMFTFNQNGAALMIITAEGMPFSSKFLRVADLSFDMGNLNDAEHWAYELLETEGQSPLVLERLVDINLAKNQLAAASVFLNALARDLVHGRRAKERLRALESDPAAQSDPRIQRARAMRWQTSSVLNHESAEQLLLDLLAQHPDNRMAFEYLMALYLLSHDQEKIRANLHRLDALGYERIPRHYEEAVMIYYDKTRQPVNLYGRQISTETAQRYKRYIEIFTKLGKNKEAAFRVLAPEFGNTYFFYSMFNVSGVGR